MNAWSSHIHIVASRLLTLLPSLLCVLPTQPALSATGPWLPQGSTQVVLLPNARVDYALRIAALSTARHAIDFATYVQSSDDLVGQSLLDYMRLAANRGVRVRGLLDRLGSALFDPLNHTVDLIADPTLANPGTIINVGFSKNLRAGLNVTDKLHWKILVIDAGTPHEVLFLGGRNNTAADFKHHDYSLMIRPVSGSSSVVTQVSEKFDELYLSLLENHNITQPGSAGLKRALPDHSPLETIIDLLSTNAERKLFNELHALLARTPTVTDELHALEFRPEKLRLLTNDFMEQALSRNHGRSFASRRRSMTNDILLAAVNAVEQAQTQVDLASMIVAIPTQLKKALTAALKRNVPLNLYTNSRKALTMYVPFGIAFDLSLKDMLDFFSAGGEDLFKVHLLHPEKSAEIKYSHAKALIADNTVFASTDNFNMTSHYRNAEIAIEAEDAHFANAMRQILTTTDPALFKRLSCEEALLMAPWDNGLKRILNRLFLSLY